MDVYRFTDTNLPEVCLRRCTLTRDKFLSLLLLVDKPSGTAFARRLLRNCPFGLKLHLRHEIPRLSVLIPMSYILYDHLIAIHTAQSAWSKEYTEYVRHIQLPVRSLLPSNPLIKYENFDSWQNLQRVKNNALDSIVLYLRDPDSELWLERGTHDYEGVSLQRLTYAINGTKPTQLREHTREYFHVKRHMLGNSIYLNYNGSAVNLSCAKHEQIQFKAHNSC